MPFSRLWLPLKKRWMNKSYMGKFTINCETSIRHYLITIFQEFHKAAGTFHVQYCTISCCTAVQRRNVRNNPVGGDTIKAYKKRSIREKINMKLVTFSSIGVLVVGLSVLLCLVILGLLDFKLGTIDNNSYDG